MSTKSLKVLNEEMSELWEKSYSVRSNSDESLSDSSDDASTQLSQTLLKALRPPQLAALRRKFTRSKRERGKDDMNAKVEAALSAAAAAEGIELPPRARDTDILTVDEPTFVQAVRDVFESSIYTPHAHHLFLHLDPFNTGRASWSSLLDRLEAVGAARVRGRNGTWQRIGNDDVQVTRLPHCQHECIVKLVPIETATSFCYCAVTRGGRAGLYSSGDFVLKYQYHVWSHRKNVTRRIKNCWVTDAVYMPDVQCLTVSSSDRCLTILDASTLSHTPLYCITSLPNIPTCLCYMPSSSSTSGQPELIFGDERGRITRITFLQPKVSLFYKVHTDRVNCFYWMGVTGMSLSPSLLAVGTRAGTVQLYTHTATRVAVLSTVTSTREAVLDVAIVENVQLVVAFTDKCVLHIWDVYEECLLQSIQINFPFVGVLGKKMDFGPYCIHPGPAVRVVSPSPGGTSEHPRSSASSQHHEGFPTSEEDIACTSIVVSCGECVCRVRLSPDVARCRVAPLSPPRDVLAPRTPTHWDIDFIKPEKTKTKTPRRHRKPISTSSSTPYPELLTPDPVHHLKVPSLETGEQKPFAVQDTDLEELLEKADLKGLMEKDFVLMSGMKHDLNKKLSELNKNMDHINRCVNMNAAHLGICLLEPTECLPTNGYTDTDATCRSGSHTYRSSN